MAQAINVTDAEFDQKVLKASAPVVVDFWAPWCGPCRMVSPILEKLAEEFDGRVTVVKVNTDDNPQYAMQYGVRGIPTILFVAGGKEVHRQVGAVPEASFRRMFEAFSSAAKSASPSAAAA